MKSTPLERLGAVAVICQTHDDGKPESRLSRLHYAVGKKSVENLVVGGYAVRFHGFTRYTGNVDFFVSISESNAQRLLEVFRTWKSGEA